MNRRTALKLFAAAPVAALVPLTAQAEPDKPVGGRFVAHTNAKKIELNIYHPDFKFRPLRHIGEPVISIVHVPTGQTPVAVLHDGTILSSGKPSLGVTGFAAGYGRVAAGNNTPVYDAREVYNGDRPLANVVFAHAPNGMMVAVFNPHGVPSAEFKVGYKGGFGGFPKEFDGYNIKFPTCGSTHVCVDDGMYRHQEATKEGHRLLAGPAAEVLVEVNAQIGNIVGDRGVSLAVVTGTFGCHGETIYAYVPAKS